MPIRQKLKNTELDMTPMIDLVFLLIVFFTLVLNFAAADQNDRVKLPVSEWAQPPEVPPTDPITLHVLASGTVIYNGNEYALQELKKQIDNHLRFLKHMNIPTEKVTAIIRADAQCESGKILDIVDLCRDSSVERFIFRTKQQEK